MSSTSMGSAKQVVRPPQRGIFPLDHDRECTPDDYVACLQQHKDKHYLCKEFSKKYLQCRMEHGLMAQEPLDALGFAGTVEGAREYDSRKEKEGFTAGKHISKESKWWWEHFTKK